jgi:hypothetical protein
MTTIPQVSQAMQKVLHEEAEKAGRASGFIKRQRKLSGASFVQTLVFGWMANPQGSLEELSQAAATCGVDISPQGLDERFSASAAECLKQVLAASLTCLIEADGGSVGLLARFRGVYLQDSTVLGLPEALREVWPNCGNQNRQGAGLKVQTMLDYQSGRLSLSLHPASANDCPLQSLDLPAGSLRLADSAYFDLQRFEQLTKRGVYWLSRVPARVRLWDEQGHSLRLSDWLAQQDGSQLDQTVYLSQRRVACRLLASRVPPHVAAQRREQLTADAKRRAKPVSQEALALVDWTVLVTNLPLALLSLEEALVLIRVRWQIELLFKLWKSHGHLATSRSAQPWRIVCEVYAKLLMLVIQHWLLLLGCWDNADRSLTKAVFTLRKHAFHLALVLIDTPRLGLALAAIIRAIRRCRLNKRRSHPATFQRLLALS